MKKRRRGRRFPLAGCLFALMAIAAAGGWWVAHELRPVSSHHREVIVSVPRGARSDRLARILKSHGLIRSELVFSLFARRRYDLTRLKAGEYRLATDMSPRDILDKLTGQAPDGELTVTIPEGFTIKQIAARLADRGTIPAADAFVHAAKGLHVSVTAPFEIPKAGLEGYLFPSTYRFQPGASPQKIAQTMVDTFTRRFFDAHRAEIARSPHSLHEIVTIASMIEREAEVPQDRPKIAGVIENRLRRHMRLQIDATLDYAFGHHLTHPTYADLRNHSPYNSYRYAGLPPGPIASPGLASLEAALRPEQSDYLFYQLGPDGKTHIFERTEQEHIRNKSRLRHAMNPLSRSWERGQGVRASRAEGEGHAL